MNKNKGSGSGGRPRSSSLSKKNNSKNVSTARAVNNKSKKRVNKPIYRLVPEHDPVTLAKYVSDSDTTGSGLEINIRVYLYGADDQHAKEVRQVLAELFGKKNVHDIEYPFAESEFMEGIYHDDFEKTPGVGIPPKTKPLSHVFKISGQYGTPAYHGIHPGNIPENDLVLTQMEYKIGHAVQQNTKNKVVMFQGGTLGAYGPNMMLIGLQTP
jgi:hypothetical protein